MTFGRTFPSGRLLAAAALLMGRIFDDRGNRMTPASAHKQGARYRYYVSAPLMQGRREEG